MNLPTRAAFLAALTMAAACQTSSAGEELSDCWFETTMAGMVVGHSHTRVSETSDSLVVTTVESRVGVERLGERVDIEETNRWTETLDGEARSCSIIRRLSAGEELALAIDVDPGVLTIVRSTDRDTTRAAVPVEGEVLFPYAIGRLHAARGFVPGDDYGYQTFDADFEGLSRVRVTVIGPDTLRVAGEERVLHVLELVPELYGGIVVREWRDENGELWIEESAELGVASTRTAGRGTAGSADRVDILAETLVATNARIPRPWRVDEALYDVRLDGTDVAELLVEDARQRIEGRTQDGVLLRVSRVVPEPGTTADVPMPATGLGEYMSGNIFVQTGDPAVASAAAEAAEEAGTDAWQRALAVERYVSEHVAGRTLGTAFASAAEVLGEGTGDCTEYAVLAAAMARAAGVPSKIITGVVHFEGSFAYHMWVEVWTGEGWYALDPTVGEGSVDATHIKLGESSLPDGRVADLSLVIMRTMKKLGIRIVEYSDSGRTIRVK